MSRVKKAEQALIDSKKSFPLDECMAKIARRYGPSAVALSGPCQGSSLAKCVCQQLSDRWDKIGERFSGNKKNVIKLAIKLAETLSLADDSERCEQFLQEKMKFEKKAATEVTSYLRAYAMDEMMDQDIDQMADEVETEDELSDLGDEPMSDEGMGGDPVADEGMDDGTEMGVVKDEDMGDESMDLGLPEEGMPEGLGEPAGGEMVSIEVPRGVAEQVLESIKSQLEGPAEGLGGLEGDIGIEGDVGIEGAPDAAVDMFSPAEEGMEGPAEEGIESPEMESMEHAPGGEEAGIPGEPAELQDEGNQVVVSKELCESCGASMASGGPDNAEQHREEVEGEGHEEKETPQWEKTEHKLGLEESDENKAEKTALSSPPMPRSKPVSSVTPDVEAKYGKAGTELKPGLFRAYCPDCHAPIKTTNQEAAGIGKVYCQGCSGDEETIDPRMPQREERQRAPVGPEDNPMGEQLNLEKGFGSRQQYRGGSSKKQEKTAQADDKQVGGKPVSNKEKQVEAPKPISEGNLDQEGYSANGTKFQDGGTIKNEQKFDAKTVDKSEISGGSSSLMGKDESYPEGNAKVPAGSSPIKNEKLTGGDVATKGTVIATIRSEGILVTAPDGR